MLVDQRASESRLSQKQPLGVAVIGLGVGEEHARAYLRSGRCRLRWLYDLDAGRLDRVARELGQGSKAEGVDTIFADPAVDVVSIASYDDDHFEQVVASLNAGKHVFAEKPLCRSVDELRRIRQAWREGGSRHLASNLVLRGAPLYQWLKRAIETGDLGEIYAFDGDYLYGRLHKITEGWRKDVEHYSVMQGGGVHLVDLMLWLTGQKPVSVAAVGNRLCTANTAFRYDDYMAATFQFASGLIGRITANFGCVHRHQHIVRVFGTKGTFLYDDLGPRLHRSREPSVPTSRVELSPLPASKGELIPPFLEGILNGLDARAQTQHEFDVIGACVAADRALRAGTAMKIAYV